MVVAAALELSRCSGFRMPHWGKLTQMHSVTVMRKWKLFRRRSHPSSDAPDLPVDVCRSALTSPGSRQVSWLQSHLEPSPLPKQELGSARAQGRAHRRAEPGLGKGPRPSRGEFLGWLRAGFWLRRGIRVVL